MYIDTEFIFIVSKRLLHINICYSLYVGKNILLVGNCMHLSLRNIDVLIFSGSFDGANYKIILLNKRGIKTLTKTDRMCHVTDVYQMRSVLCYIQGNVIKHFY
ncbi:MAG: hypothetical protein DWB56_10660 [Candidatus Jettenia sp.]|nr:MAG: hypothetical protein EDM77_14685 [Candidatus Jettenia sp. AMX1]MBC6929406.1 hypothetical protein [Candidatus Jettenia sp.]MCE7880807.1 hypothetical protein [Candidatus Jettenia sp. AMX1]MCQ3927591.1 hypothetical protein [Candidatus Jettenia sp.]